MYLVRFCYDLKPTDRNEVIELIRQEVEAAKGQNLRARLLVPLTRGRKAPALEYEVEIPRLDVLEPFRDRAIEADENATHDWMRKFSHLLQSPPSVTIYRIDEEASKEAGKPA